MAGIGMSLESHPTIDLSLETSICDTTIASYEADLTTVILQQAIASVQRILIIFSRQVDAKEQRIGALDNQRTSDRTQMLLQTRRRTIALLNNVSVRELTAADFATL